MGHTVQAANVLDAARRYGDARVVYEKVAQKWKFGDSREELQRLSELCRESEVELHRAARFYATNMRRKAK